MGVKRSVVILLPHMNTLWYVVIGVIAGLIAAAMLFMSMPSIHRMDPGLNVIQNSLNTSTIVYVLPNDTILQLYKVTLLNSSCTNGIQATCTAFLSMDEITNPHIISQIGLPLPAINATPFFNVTKGSIPSSSVSLEPAKRNISVDVQVPRYSLLNLTDNISSFLQETGYAYESGVIYQISTVNSSGTTAATLFSGLLSSGLTFSTQSLLKDFTLESNGTILYNATALFKDGYMSHGGELYRYTLNKTGLDIGSFGIMQVGSQYLKNITGYIETKENATQTIYKAVNWDLLDPPTQIVKVQANYSDLHGTATTIWEPTLFGIQIPIDPVFNPSGVIAYSQVNITNSQTSAAPSPFQEMVNLSLTNYLGRINESSKWAFSNVEFFNGTSGTVLNSWLENYSFSTKWALFWINLPNGIPASTTLQDVYVGFGTNTTEFWSNTSVGEAPTLSPSYGGRDDGFNVFNFYDDFAGTALNTSKWVNNGVSSSTVTVDNGIYMEATSEACANSVVVSSKTYTTPNGGVFGIYGNLVLTSTASCGDGQIAGFQSTSESNVIGLNGEESSSGWHVYTSAADTVLNPPIYGDYAYNVYFASLTSTAYGSSDYNAQVSAAGSSTTVAEPIGFAPGTYARWMNITWVRVASYPPNDVMPTISQGSVQIVIGITLYLNGVKNANTTITYGTQSNFTCTDPNKYCALWVNGSKVSPLTKSLNIFLHTYSAGLYKVTAGSNASGVANLTYYETISKATPTLKILDNVSTFKGGPGNFTYNGTKDNTSVSITTLNSQLSGTLYINGVNRTITHSKSYYTNATAGTYSAVFNTSGNKNYTSVSVKTESIISKSSPVLRLWLESALNSNVSFAYPNLLNVTANITSLANQLSAKLVYQPNGSSLATLSSGFNDKYGPTLLNKSARKYYVFNLTTAGNINYTSSFDKHSATITPGISSCDVYLNGNKDSNSTIVYDTQTDVTVSCNNGQKVYLDRLINESTPPLPGPVDPPLGIYWYSQINITNSQASAAPAPFQEMVNISLTNYLGHINESSKWAFGNVEFFNGTSGAVLKSWLESYSFSKKWAIFWIVLPNGVPSSATLSDTYVGFGANTTTFWNNNSVGEAPALSPSYAGRDDGKSVFTNYWNFNGTSLPSGWASSGTVTVNNGLSLAQNTNSGGVSTTSTYSPSILETDISVGSDTDTYIGYSLSSSVGTINEYRIFYSSFHNDYQLQNGGGTNLGGTSFESGNTGSITWASTGNERLSYNYYSLVNSTDTSDTYQSSYIQIYGVANGDGDTLDWVRLRAYPPNGVMPSISQGSLQVNDPITLLLNGVQGNTTIQSSIQSNFTATIPNSQWVGIYVNGVKKVGLTHNKATYLATLGGGVYKVTAFSNVSANVTYYETVSQTDIYLNGFHNTGLNLLYPKTLNITVNTTVKAYIGIYINSTKETSLQLNQSSYLASLSPGLYSVTAYSNSSAVENLTYDVRVLPNISIGYGSIQYLKTLAGSHFYYYGIDQPSTQNWTGNFAGLYNQTIKPYNTTNTLFLDSASANLIKQYGQKINVTGKNTNITAFLKINGSSLANPSDKFFGHGYYEITVYDNGNENYTGYNSTFLGIHSTNETFYLNVTKYPFVTVALSLPAPPRQWNERLNLTCSYSSNITAGVPDIKNGEVLNAKVTANTNSTPAAFSLPYNPSYNNYSKLQGFNTSHFSINCSASQQNFSAKTSINTAYNLSAVTMSNFTITRSVLANNNITASMAVSSVLPFLTPSFSCNGVPEPVTGSFKSTFNATLQDQYDCFWTVKNLYNVTTTSPLQESIALTPYHNTPVQKNTTSVFAIDQNISMYYQNYINFTNKFNQTWSHNYTYLSGLAPVPTSVSFNGTTYDNISSIDLNYTVGNGKDFNKTAIWTWKNAIRITNTTGLNASYPNVFGNGYNISQVVTATLDPINSPSFSAVKVNDSCDFLENLLGKGKAVGIDCLNYTMTFTYGSPQKVVYSWIRENGTNVTYKNVTLVQDVLGSPLKGFEVYNITNRQYVPINALLNTTHYEPSGWTESPQDFAVPARSNQTENISAAGQGTTVGTFTSTTIPSSSTVINYRYSTILSIPNSTRAWIISNPASYSLIVGDFTGLYRSINTTLSLGPVSSRTAQLGINAFAQSTPETISVQYSAVQMSNQTNKTEPLILTYGVSDNGVTNLTSDIVTFTPTQVSTAESFIVLFAVIASVVLLWRYGHLPAIIKKIVKEEKKK